MKTCNKCKIEKEIELFELSYGKVNSRRGVCKKCNLGHFEDDVSVLVNAAKYLRKEDF